MFSQACDLAQSLNLHNLDAFDAEGVPSTKLRSDEDRRGFWQLIQCDVYFRLLLNKPPSITATAWKVNLPSIDVDGSDPLAIPTMCFLVSSRVTIVIISFFAILEDKYIGKEARIAKTEELCREIDNILTEWQLVSRKFDPFSPKQRVLAVLTSELQDEWIGNNHRKEEDSFLIWESLLTGHLSIILMLCKAHQSNPSQSSLHTSTDLPHSPLAVQAARKIIQIATTHALSNDASAEILSLNLGTIISPVPLGCLYRDLIQADDITGREEDIQALAVLERKAYIIAQTQTEFSPLVRVLHRLNQELGNRFAG